MIFLIDIEGSCSGSKTFTDEDSAINYYHCVVLGLIMLNDKDTNVTLMKSEKENDDQWNVLLQRFNKYNKPKT
jgi:hypothetical protein